MSLYDITGSLVLQWEGTIKGEHDQASGLLLLSSGCFDTTVRVFQQATDPLLQLSWCPSSRKHN